MGFVYRHNMIFDISISGTPTVSGTYTVNVTPTHNGQGGVAIGGNLSVMYITFSIIINPTYTHTIFYNANGGGGYTEFSRVTDTNSGNTNVTFASNGFTAPAGHYFAGWRIDNTGTVYQPGNTYAVGANGSVIAYAYWLPSIAKTNVNVNGSWVKGSVYVNVNGTWTESKKIYVKVNGVWEESSG